MGTPVKRKISWSSLKTLAINKVLPMQYIPDDEQAYLVSIVDGNFEVYARILKTDPANSDQTDFETNYLPTINKRLTADVDENYNLKSALYGGSDNTKIGNIGDKVKVSLGDGSEYTTQQINDSVTTAGTPEVITATGNKTIIKALIVNQKKGPNGNNADDLLYVSVDSETNILTIPRNGSATITGSMSQIKIDSNNDGTNFEIFMVRVV